MVKRFQKIMIFGRPGSGKSMFAHSLSQKTGIPLHHLDKYFFQSNWVERDRDEFMRIQETIVCLPNWIIDGNSVRSLETRWSRADLVLYFNVSKYRCLYRVIKRLFEHRGHIDDRADHCPEILRLRFIKYMWRFEKRVAEPIKKLKTKYGCIQFIEIGSDHDILEVEGML